MTSRYFIELSYRGTRYHGWQIQQNAVTIQGELNRALSTLLRIPTGTIGAGRTDTGVHARYYVAHFDSTHTDLDCTPGFLHSLNRILPFDIAVHRIFRVKNTANARFDATLRGYEYHMVLGKDPFMQDYAWLYHGKLDIISMQQATNKLFEYSDFTSFSRSGSDNKTNLCRIYRATWRSHCPNLLIFAIEADRFLRNMVRAIVGTLVDVGRGKLTPDDFARIIEQKNRSKAGTSAPAQGLYLTRIVYPPSVLP